MPESKGDPRRWPPPPPMVLVDRYVTLVDELAEFTEEFIKEIGGLPLDRRIESALKRLTAVKHVPECSSSNIIDRGTQEQMAIEEEKKRYRAEVEEPALALLRERKASHPSAVRKEPLPESIDDDDSPDSPDWGIQRYSYRALLDGIEPCLSQVTDAPPSVTRLSLKIAWPPCHLLSGYPYNAFIVSCHHCFLVLYIGTYHPWYGEPGFYLVYNALDNLLAIVPPLRFLNYMSQCDIGPVAVLCCSMEEGDYVLAELLLCRDVQTLRTTNKATFFIWVSSFREWVEREVVLPLPTAAVVDDEKDTTIGTCSFRADMSFGVSFSSICWVDLLTGILVYNHIPSEQFHFIPLPEECITSLVRYGQDWPDEYRSMCCIDRQTLKFVAMDETCSQECPMLTTWTLRRPLSPTNWKWEKDVVSSFCMKDLWEDQVYKDKLLRPLWPRCPVISTQEPGIIYLSVTDYKDNQSHYVLSINMDRCRVESVYKDPSDENAITLSPRLFTSDFSCYLNKTKAWELMHGASDDLYEGLRGKAKIADDVESRSNPSNPYTLGVDLGILKISSCRVIPTPRGPSSRKTGPLESSFRLVGLQVVLDIAIC